MTADALSGVKFLEQLHNEVSERARDSDADDELGKSEAFTALVAEELEDYGKAEGLEACRIEEHTGKGVIRCDGYWLGEEGDRLDLFVSFYSQAEPGETITQTEIRLGFERARRILQLIDQGWDLGDRTRSGQTAMIDALRSAAAAIKEVRVFVLTDRVARDTKEIKEVHEGRQSRCFIWDATRLSRVRQSGKDYESIKIDVLEECGSGIPCLPAKEQGSGYRTFLAFIPGALLFHLYDEYGPQLLQLNVRSYLQARGKVNKGIQDTIINRPGRFLAYNNGITATVENLECAVNSDGQQVITQLTGFQVVNGGQTVASIHQTVKKHGADCGGLSVQAKISVVDEELLDEIVPCISRYANTQNRVSEADFSSNDPLHLQIENLSGRLWCPGERTRWFYERARGQYQVAKSRYSTTPARRKKFEEETPTSQKITKTDLAKYINSWGQLPHMVSRGAQKNFTAFMAEDGNGLQVDEAWYKHLIGQAILFKAAERIARKLKITPYRANAITYTVALVSYRTQKRVSLVKLWENQTGSEALKSTLSTWMVEVHQELADSAHGKNVTEWCKKPECWRHIMMMDLPLPSELEQELAEGQPLPNVGKEARSGKVSLTPEDRANIAKTMLVSDEVWLEIHRWGIRDDNLSHIQRGIAHTLVAYAAGNWAKVPSKKQAAQAVKMIEKAKACISTLRRIQGI
jgi:hypothetical protein